MDKVSIIVPIYNEEASINMCVDHICRQTHPHIEIILINDGSTDNSGLICNEQEKTDERIKVIHQQNNGPSRARNAGIKIATGTYIQFVDADDYVEREMTEKLVAQMKRGVELVICGYTQHTAVKDVITPKKAGIYRQDEIIHCLGELYRATLFPSPCNKMYRKEVIHQANIRFQEDFSIGEDLLFNLDYLDASQTIYLLNEPLYHYQSMVHDSLTNQYHEDVLTNQQLLHNEIRSFLKKHATYFGENKQILQQMEVKSTIHALEHCFHHRSGFTRKEQREQLKLLIQSNALQQVLPAFGEAFEHRLIKRLIKHNAIRRLTLLFTMKKYMQAHFPGMYKQIKQQRNK